VSGENALVLAAAMVIVFVWLALGLGRVFEKLGEQPGAAWVPVLNIATLLRLGSVSPRWALALLIPLLNVLALARLVVAIHRVSARFGAGAGTTVIGAVALPIWASILGFGAAVPTEGITGEPRNPPVRPAPPRHYGSPGVPANAAPGAPAWLSASPSAPERWLIVTDDGDSSKIRGTVAVLGRNPTIAGTTGEVQLITILDPAKSVSKTHARLALADGAWWITDLNSTNGVHVIAPDGQNLRLVPGVPAIIGESFRLGDIMLRMLKEG
jgi:hypothetical protein